jgi:Fe-Mn family superoxide dismutase
MDSTRRRFLGTTGALVAGAGATPAQGGSGPDVPNAFAALREPRPLRFDPNRLRGLSKGLIESHWSNNYVGSVRTLNAVKTRLAAAAADPQFPAYAYNGLKREHLVRTGSVVLHELYFDNFGGDGRADEAMRRLIAGSFGSFDAWESEFRRIAMGLGGGSGWVVLARNVHLGTVENYWLADHAHFPAGAVPLLVLDMYEHSYQMDYGAAAARYIDAAFANFDWETVAQRAGS